jgi:hypothetical protein
MANDAIDVIGCDLGDKVSEICVLHTDDRMERHRIKTTRAAMESFFRRSRTHVVVEVGTHSRWVRSATASSARPAAHGKKAVRPEGHGLPGWRLGAPAAKDEPTAGCEEGRRAGRVRFTAWGWCG